MSEEMRGARVNWSRRMLLGGLLMFAVSAIFILFLPAIITEGTWGYSLGRTNANEIGDAIGGITGPAVGLLGGLLAFLAFWAQYDANIRQRREFGITLAQQRNEANAQIKTSSTERFESKFYMMLEIHRENATSLVVNNISGRKVFLHLFHELRFLYWAVRGFYYDNIIGFSSSPLSEEDIFQAAYLTFFFGYGPDSTEMVIDLAGTRFEPFLNNLHDYLDKNVAFINEHFGSKEPLTIGTPEGVELWKRAYKLGTGHLTRLSHYLRHLFQTIKFVDDQDDELLDYDSKYNYISNVRAQLSVHEQLLLYYNARSVLGQPWLEKKDGESLIERYCMIKSIALNTADFYESPEEFFKSHTNKKGKPMFEWTEIRQRMNTLQS